MISFSDFPLQLNLGRLKKVVSWENLAKIDRDSSVLSPPHYMLISFGFPLLVEGIFYRFFLNDQ